MKTLTVLLHENPPRSRATPADYRLGAAIFAGGGVRFAEASPYKVVASVRPAGGQRRNVTMTSTESGLSCRCT